MVWIDLLFQNENFIRIENMKTTYFKFMLRLGINFRIFKLPTQYVERIRQSIEYRLKKMFKLKNEMTTRL